MKTERLNEIFKEIASRNKGRLTPRLVVAYARPVNSPLHKYFDWNNNVAGDKWRLHQARNLIIQVTYKVTKDASVNAWVNFNTKKLGGQCYVQIEKALSEKDLKKEMLRRALQEVNYWKQQYLTILELKPIFNVIDEVSRKVKEEIRS